MRPRDAHYTLRMLMRNDGLAEFENAYSSELFDVI